MGWKFHLFYGGTTGECDYVRTVLDSDVVLKNYAGSDATLFVVNAIKSHQINITYLNSVSLITHKFTPSRMYEHYNTSGRLRQSNFSDYIYIRNLIFGQLSSVFQKLLELVVAKTAIPIISNASGGGNLG